MFARLFCHVANTRENKGFHGYPWEFIWSASCCSYYHFQVTKGVYQRYSWFNRSVQSSQIIPPLLLPMYNQHHHLPPKRYFTIDIYFTIYFLITTITEKELSQSTLFIQSFPHSVSYLRQNQLQRLLSSELFTILEYTAERLATAIGRNTMILH